MPRRRAQTEVTTRRLCFVMIFFLDHHPFEVGPRPGFGFEGDGLPSACNQNVALFHPGHIHLARKVQASWIRRLAPLSRLQKSSHAGMLGSCLSIARHNVLISTHDHPFSYASSSQSVLSLETRGEGRRHWILHGDQVIALRPVTVHADDYAIREYGVTEQELDRFAKRADQQITRGRKAGTIKKYSGNLEADLAD